VRLCGPEFFAPRLTLRYAGRPFPARMPLTLYLLGRPVVVDDGGRMTLPNERRCQLLCLLALRRGWVTRTELAALFWPRQRTEQALTNVRKALHQARALPWAAALESQGHVVRFAVETDVQHLVQAMREGRLADALRRDAGELLDGMDDVSAPTWDDWLADERAQHARRRHDLTRARLAQLAAQPAEAIAFARRLLDADPLDEDAVVALLAAQRALGQREEQHEAYRRFAVRLDEELGVAPSQRVASELVEPPALPQSEADGFVGRRRELNDLAALLAHPECRLITITGPGGVGKSSLAKHGVREYAARGGGSAIWIALDDLADVEQAVARLVAELGIAPAPRQDAVQLACERLQRDAGLVVFDNAEHVAGIARLLSRLLDAAPRLRLCATSRRRLGVAGEWLLPLRGLALAPAGADLGELLASDATRLFIATACAARPGFDARAEASAIGALLHAVDGLPLAILLAAHWVRLLPVAEIAAEVTRSLDVLDSGDEEGEERPEHRSVRATFERSWQLLATREQRALAALAVFVGSFPRAAAIEVAGAALPLLAALADKSLLQMPAGGRCALHPLIRQFAAGMGAPEEAATYARHHAEWFHRLLARMARDAEGGDAAALDAIAAELENCRLAWRWAVAADASAALAGSAPALMRCFEARNRAEEGAALLAEALPRVATMPPTHAAVVLSALAHLQYRVYRLDDAAASARQALRLARTTASAEARLRCLNVLGLCHWQWGRLAEARRLLEQTLRLARAGNQARAIAIALGNLANVDKDLGHYERARAGMLEVLERQRALGDWLGVAIRLNNLASLHQARHEWNEARVFLDEALAVAARHGIAFVRPHALVNLALVDFFTGDLEAAAHHGRGALAEARAVANRNVEATALLHLVRVAVRQGALEEARTGVRQALACALAMGSVPLQLDAVFGHAEIAAATGERAAAADLLRWYLARPEVAPGDRAVAQASLDALDAPAAKADPDLPPHLPLEDLLQRLAQPSPAAPAAD